MSAPLGPLPTLPPHAAGLTGWKILLLCTAINSFSQRTITYLKFLGLERVSVCLASSAEALEEAAERLQPDLVICPYLTTMVPSAIFTKYITLVVHPGPPGDEGPAALDWTLLGDTGEECDSAVALQALLGTHESPSQRSHWGAIVFQANEVLDAGKVWAWEQYELPPIGTVTKASLYQNQHSVAAINALITAIIRVYAQVDALEPAQSRIDARPEPSWEELSVTLQSTFLGGQTRNRPQIAPKLRKPDWTFHTAADIQRIIHASDSQPGAQIGPLVDQVKSNLFVYGAHIESDERSIPRTLYTAQGYATWDEIPLGKIVATRGGAALFKTRPGAGAGVWITHGRVIKRVGQPLEPKIPLVDAIRATGQEKALAGVQEWEQASYEETPGTWQEVCVRTEVHRGQLAQCIYWDFYNGAFLTRQCQILLKALQWATAPERGNVRVLALMGGAYFSNGIALNTIEAASDPGLETWRNINAIDDVVEYLLSDTHNERSPFMQGVKPLCERGIITIACVRSNAAAGGVALAAACDVTIGARGVVLNPAYRAMGLHGSEFHSYSYLARCGPNAPAMLRDMLPQSTFESYNTGLIDVEVGSYTSSKADIHAACIDHVRSLLDTAPTRCAPWCRPSGSTTTLDDMCATKRATYTARTTPLLHYRNEELSQMLLDSFHPVRSKRYHTRRYTFIRKVKGGLTPSRYANELATVRDEEELHAFDNAPGWTRGIEWAWAGEATPASLTTSEWTRIRLYEDVSPKIGFAPLPIVQDVGSPPRLAPPLPRKDSEVSQLSAASSESTHGPITPPIKYAFEAPLREGTARLKSFRRRSSGFTRESSISADALIEANTLALVTTIGGKGDSPSSRFETLSKKLAAAWKTAPGGSTTPKQKKRSSIIFPPGMTTTSILLSNGPSPKSADQPLPEPMESRRASYIRPNVKGADQCEHPCLYEPEAAKVVA